MGLDAMVLREDPAGALLLHKTPAAQPFAQWLRATVAEDEAALKIQGFLRDKLRLTGVASLRRTASTASSSSSLEAADDTAEVAVVGAAAAHDDSAHRQFEVLLWHGSSLGALQLELCASSA